MYITMRFIHCWDTAFWNTQWCISPFRFIFKNLLHVSDSVILLNIWLKNTKNHFYLISFSKHKVLSNLTWTPLVFVNSIKKVLAPVDIFTVLLFLPKHLSLYEWSPKFSWVAIFPCCKTLNLCVRFQIVVAGETVLSVT